MAVDPDVLVLTDAIDTRLDAMEGRVLTPSDDLQAAHDALGSEGGVLRLSEGLFAQSLSVTNHGVKIVGAGYDENNDPAYGTIIRPSSGLAAGVGALNITGRFATVSGVNVDADGLADYAINVEAPGWASQVHDVGAKEGLITSLRVAQPRCRIHRCETRTQVGSYSTAIEAPDCNVVAVACSGGSTSAMRVGGGSAQVVACHTDTSAGPHSLIVDASHVSVTATHIGTSVVEPLAIRATGGHRVGVQVKDCLIKNPNIVDMTGAAVLIDSDPSWKIKRLALSGLTIESGQNRHTYAVALGPNPTRVVGLMVSDTQMYRCDQPWDVEPFAHSGNVIYKDQWGDSPQLVEV